MDGIHFHSQSPGAIPTVQQQVIQNRNSEKPEKRISISNQTEISVSTSDMIAQVPDLRMEMRFHEDLGQVVIKVIDRATDKVIEELPAAELQKIRLNLRQAVGLIVDEEA